MVFGTCHIWVFVGSQTLYTTCIAWSLGTDTSIFGYLDPVGEGPCTCFFDVGAPRRGYHIVTLGLTDALRFIEILHHLLYILCMYIYIYTYIVYVLYLALYEVHVT